MIWDKRQKNAQTDGPTPAAISVPLPGSRQGVPNVRTTPWQHPPGTKSLIAPEPEPVPPFPVPAPYPLPPKETAQLIRREMVDIRKALERAKAHLNIGAVPFEDAIQVQLHLDDIDGYLGFIEYDLSCMLGDVES